ncbi:MAG: TldD/PmbA family protein [Actinomycetota bacterium]
MIDRDVINRALAEALKRGGDFADIFVERKSTDKLKLEDGKIESFTAGHDAGAGLRVISGASTYYVYTDILTPASVLEAAAALAEAVGARAGAEPRNVIIPLNNLASGNANLAKIEPSKVSQDFKAGIARRADAAAREAGGEIIQATVSLADSVQEVVIASSDGAYAADKRVLTRIFVLAVAKRSDRVESGYEAPGISGGFELFETESPEKIGRLAAGRALMLLDAIPAPAGNMPVVLGNGTGGVLFHEACGHGLEADAIRKGASVFAGKTGQKVAADVVSAADDPSLPHRWGSFGFDDEGTPAVANSLIEEGVLKGFLYDKFNARLAGVPTTPNGRRQSFRHIPVPRMTNTYIKPGAASFEDMLSGLKRGFYAKSLGGGEVNPANGDYVFGVTEGYLIANGQVAKPVKGAVLVGNGPRTLFDIDLVGGDLDFDAGMCGKAGQSVPAGTGQPSLRIKELTVGGTG